MERLIFHVDVNSAYLSWEAARRVAEDVTALGAEFCLFQADLGDSAAVEALFDKMESSFGEADVLVNNAGIAQQKLFTDLADEDWHRMMRVDLDGVFYCTRRALKPMLHRHLNQHRYAADQDYRVPGNFFLYNFLLIPQFQHHAGNRSHDGPKLYIAVIFQKNRNIAGP